MKPQHYTEAHHKPYFAELVCSNSLRSDQLSNGVGLLKQEMRFSDSLIMRCADKTKVPAGGALAVDRDQFGQMVTATIKEQANVQICEHQVHDLRELIADKNKLVVVATGPLTTGDLYNSVLECLGEESLFFFDAAAPIVFADSLEQDSIFHASRYGKGTADYLNCPLNREQYLQFYHELKTAKRATVHDFDSSNLFSGCMPIEEMAELGEDTMRFGPLKPVGLVDPKTGKEPYACVQLRKENVAGNLYNLVGFQTRLTQGEQKRVFGLIPGLKDAKYARYGVMHRNTYLNSPKLLVTNYRSAKYKNLYFAGQITGVEGYIESAGSGLVVGKCIAQLVSKQTAEHLYDEHLFPATTMLGAMSRFVLAMNKNFQPMNANFGLLPEIVGDEAKKLRQELEISVKGRKGKRLLLAGKALKNFMDITAVKKLLKGCM